MSLRAKWLGKAMRELRERRGLNLKHAAAHADIDLGDLRRHENGVRVFSHDRVTRLLDLYRVYDRREYDRLVRLAEDAWREADAHAQVHDPSLVDLHWLESSADRIQCYATTLIPELLQTDRYAEAVTAIQQPRAAKRELTEAVTALLDRQRILRRPHPPELHVVVAEGVLHRPVGAADVLAEQLQHLAEAGHALHLRLQVLPAGAGYQPGMDHAFTLLEPPHPFPTVAAVHQPGLRLVLDDATAHLYTDAFDRLHTHALQVRDSIDLITGLSKQMAG